MTSILSTISGQFTRSLILGTFFPVVVFLILSLLLVKPLLPQELSTVHAFQRLDTPWEILVFTFTAVLLTGFLYNVNIPILRFYEGYPWRESKFGRWRRTHYEDSFKEVVGMIPRLRAVRDAWKAIQTDHPNVFKLEKELGQLGLLLSFGYPSDSALILPTRFGNVIRSFETYPDKQYGIDAVTFWPRLTAVSGKDAVAAAEDAKSSLDFFVNCSVLSTFLAGALFIVTGFSVGNPNVPVETLIQSTVGAGSALFCSYLFYLGATARASSWGSEVRSVFDLYRWDLLEKIGYQQTPSTRMEERVLWDAVSKQVLYGDPPFGPPLPYKETVHAERTIVRADPSDLVLEICGGVRKAARGVLDFHYRIRNTDPQGRAATSVILTESLPSGIAYVWDSATLNGAFYQPSGTNPLIFTLGRLTRNEVVEVSYSALPTEPKLK